MWQNTGTLAKQTHSTACQGSFDTQRRKKNGVEKERQFLHVHIYALRAHFNQLSQEFTSDIGIIKPPKT